MKHYPRFARYRTASTVIYWSWLAYAIRSRASPPNSLLDGTGCLAGVAPIPTTDEYQYRIQAQRTPCHDQARDRRPRQVVLRRLPARRRFRRDQLNANADNSQLKKTRPVKWRRVFPDRTSFSHSGGSGRSAQPPSTDPGRTGRDGSAWGKQSSAFGSFRMTVLRGAVIRRRSQVATGVAVCPIWRCFLFRLGRHVGAAVARHRSRSTRWDSA
jgi:hypothetical protein